MELQPNDFSPTDLPYVHQIQTTRTTPMFGMSTDSFNRALPKGLGERIENGPSFHGGASIVPNHHIKFDLEFPCFGSRTPRSLGKPGSPSPRLSA